MVASKINFSPGAKISWRKKSEKIGHRTRFFSQKGPRIYLKQVPESSHKTGSLGVSQHIGTLILSQSGMSFSHLAFIGWQVDLTGTGSFLLGSLSGSPQQRLHTLGHGLCQPPECPSKEPLSGWLWQRRQINSLPSHFPSLAFCRFLKKQILFILQSCPTSCHRNIVEQVSKTKTDRGMVHTLQKVRLNCKFCSSFFLGKWETGLTKKSFCPKKLSGIGGTSPPLAEKIL